MKGAFSTPVCARKQTNGPPGIDQGFSTGSCNRRHALSARAVLVWFPDPSCMGGASPYRKGLGTKLEGCCNSRHARSPLVSCPDYFSPSGREKCGLGMRLGHPWDRDRGRWVGAPLWPVHPPTSPCPTLSASGEPTPPPKRDRLSSHSSMRLRHKMYSVHGSSPRHNPCLEFNPLST